MMAMLSRVANNRNGAELLLENKILEVLASMKVFDMHPVIRVNNFSSNSQNEEFVPPPDTRYRQVLFPAINLCENIISTLTPESHSTISQVINFLLSHCDTIETILRCATPYMELGLLQELSCVTGLIARCINQEIYCMADLNSNEEVCVGLYRIRRLMLSVFSRFVISDNALKEMLKSENLFYEPSNQNKSLHIKYFLEIASNLSLYCRNANSNHSADHRATGILFSPRNGCSLPSFYMLVMSRSNDSRVIRVLQFLDAYERQESLWNPALESYKNKIARDEAYMHIIQELNNPSLSIHDIKLKVKSIRTTYTKELRLVIKNKKLGKAYTPKLFWFNRANSFLKDVSLSRDKKIIPLRNSEINSVDKEFGIDCVSNSHILSREICDEISNEEDGAITSSCAYEYKLLQPNSNADANSDDMVECNITERPRAEVEQIHNFQSNQTIETKFCNTPPSDVTNSIELRAKVANISNNSEDEYDIFCRSVAIQLRSITDTYSRSVAKLKIQQILFEAETGHYRNSPCITIPVNQPISSL